MSENSDDRMASAFANMEADNFQGVSLTKEQYAEFNEEASGELAKMICERRKWEQVRFVSVEEFKDGGARVLYRKVSK